VPELRPVGHLTWAELRTVILAAVGLLLLTHRFSTWIAKRWQQQKASNNGQLR
jgi:hypothetical protein